MKSSIARRAVELAKHAFGLRTLAPIAASFFSGWTALADKKMSVDDPDFWIIALCGLGLGGLSWAAISYDSFVRDKEAKLLNKKLGDALRVAEVVGLTVLPNIGAVDLSGISNDALKNIVAKFTGEIVDFSNNIKDAQSRRDALSFIELGTISEDAAKILRRKQIEAIYENRDELKREFVKSFKLNGEAIAAELKRRSSYQPSGVEAGWEMPLSDGILAGVNPILTIASVMDKMARHLPD